MRVDLRREPDELSQHPFARRSHQPVRRKTIRHDIAELPQLIQPLGSPPAGAAPTRRSALPGRSSGESRQLLVPQPFGVGMLDHRPDLLLGEGAGNPLVQQLPSAQRLRPRYLTRPTQVHQIDLLEAKVGGQQVERPEQPATAGHGNREIKIPGRDRPPRVGGTTEGDQQLDARIQAESRQLTAAGIAAKLVERC